MVKIRVGGSPWMTANIDPWGSRENANTGSAMFDDVIMMSSFNNQSQ